MPEGPAGPALPALHEWIWCWHGAFGTVCLRAPYRGCTLRRRYAAVGRGAIHSASSNFGLDERLACVHREVQWRAFRQL